MTPDDLFLAPYVSAYCATGVLLWIGYGMTRDHIAQRR